MYNCDDQSSFTSFSAAASSNIWSLTYSLVISKIVVLIVFRLQQLSASHAKTPCLIFLKKRSVVNLLVGSFTSNLCGFIWCWYMKSHECGFPLHWWAISWSVGIKENSVCEGGNAYRYKINIKGRTILSMLTITLWTELWRIDLQKAYLNRYGRKWIEIVIGLGALWDWIDIACKCPFIHQNLNLIHVLQAAIWP